MGRDAPCRRAGAGSEGRPANPGVDEKAFRKGHRYHTIVCDLERAIVEFVAEERTTASLAAYYTQLTEAQRDGRKSSPCPVWATA